MDHHERAGADTSAHKDRARFDVLLAANGPTVRSRAARSHQGLGLEGETAAEAAASAGECGATRAQPKATGTGGPMDGRAGRDGGMLSMTSARKRHLLPRKGETEPSDGPKDAHVERTRRPAHYTTTETHAIGPNEGGTRKGEHGETRTKVTKKRRPAMFYPLTGTPGASKWQCQRHLRLRRNFRDGLDQWPMTQGRVYLTHERTPFKPRTTGARKSERQADTNSATIGLVIVS